MPELLLVEALILADILAPTDAALGQAVVSSPRVPERIRQTLNVESGLNDGIALPALLFAISLGAELVGGNGSIAAFTAGVATGNSLKQVMRDWFTRHWCSTP